MPSPATRLLAVVIVFMMAYVFLNTSTTGNFSSATTLLFLGLVAIALYVILRPSHGEGWL